LINDRWAGKMYNTDTELLFPIRMASRLASLRGIEWKQLVDHIESENAQEEDRLAFTLLMVKLGGCQSCNPHSYRALRGCAHCSQQTIKRFRGDDTELLEKYELSLNEIKKYLSGKKDNKSSMEEL
jgi:hypothetical protein